MRKLSRQTKRDLVAYSFIAPNFIGFCVFTLIPIIFAFALAFMKWDGSNPIQWAGISNFTRLWKDTFFIAAFKNTIIYCIGTVPLTMIASLALAIVLNQKVIGRGIFRTLSFFPYVASLVAITAVWKMLFHPSKGPGEQHSAECFQCTAGSASPVVHRRTGTVLHDSVQCMEIYGLLYGNLPGRLTGNLL